MASELDMALNMARRVDDSGILLVEATGGADGEDEACDALDRFAAECAVKSSFMILPSRPEPLTADRSTFCSRAILLTAGVASTLSALLEVLTFLVDERSCFGA